jgi:hypothetical protein
MSKPKKKHVHIIDKKCRKAAKTIHNLKPQFSSTGTGKKKHIQNTKPGGNSDYK